MVVARPRRRKEGKRGKWCFGFYRFAATRRREEEQRGNSNRVVEPRLVVQRFGRVCGLVVSRGLIIRPSKEVGNFVQYRTARFLRWNEAEDLQNAPIHILSLVSSLEGLVGNVLLIFLIVPFVGTSCGYFVLRAIYRLLSHRSANRFTLAVSEKGLESCSWDLFPWVKSSGSSLFSSKRIHSGSYGWFYARIQSDPFNYLINTFNCHVVRNKKKHSRRLIAWEVHAERG